ncbi:MAG: hypothetical protein KIT87_06565, partial [Anaerolineae bacterium]|nr:hypothetical protein [Anaerolineae bacterium]
MQRTLRELLDESFSVADLTTLCYDLGLVYEALGGESKPARVVALLQWAGQRGRLGDLMLAGRRLRSDLDWDDLLDAATPSGPGLPAEPRLFLSVPARPEGLVGRDQRVADIVTLLRQGAPRVAVHGLPGVGKTTLAAALAYSRDILRLLPGGVLWASLGPTGSPATALAAWSIALGVPLGEASRPDDRAQRLQAVLAQRPPCLVVLDDAWRYEQVRPLLGVATPDSAFLLTTRQADLARAFSPRATLYLPELPTSEAADLLVEICPPVATADRAALEDLAGRVGGLH